MVHLENHMKLKHGADKEINNSQFDQTEDPIMYVIPKNIINNDFQLVPEDRHD